MRKFQYTAVNLQKEKFSGIFMAQDEHDLAVQLSKQNLFLVSSSPYSGLAKVSFFSVSSGKVTINELTTFCRQFAIMLNSGMSILSSLDSLRGQAYTPYFKQVLDTIYEDVKGGEMLSNALEKHKSVFPNFFRSMVNVGEVSGKLETVCNSLADYYDNENKIRKRTKGAMSYPLMLLGMTVAIVIAMMVFIVPTFRESLSSLDVEAEGLTKIVYDISDFCLEYWTYMLIGALVIGGSIFGFLKTKIGKKTMDIIKIRAPLISKITVGTITSKFARGFGLLLTSGMDVVEALDSIVIVIGNSDVEARFKKATDEVRQGSSLSMAFSKYKLFPDLLIQMIAVGERTASLDEVLTRSANFFDDQAESTIMAVTSKIQPAMLIFMGAVIAVLFVAIYSPMLSIMTSIV